VKDSPDSCTVLFMAHQWTQPAAVPCDTATAFDLLVEQWQDIVKDRESFKRSRYERIRRSDLQSTDAALLALVVGPNIVELFTVELDIAPCKNFVIRRHGDLIVGFSVESALVLLKLWVGDMLVDGFQLEPGRACFAFSDEHCILDIAMRYQDIDLRLVSRSDARVCMVGAMLQTNMRRQIASSLIFFERELALCKLGLFAGCSKNAVAWVPDRPEMRDYQIRIPDRALFVAGECPVVEFPSLRNVLDNSWRMMVEKKRMWLLDDCNGMCIKEEFMQRVWQPARVERLLGLDALDYS
jgi:hypothetical protein